MPDVEVEVPAYTNITLEIDVSDYISSIVGEISDDDVIQHLSEMATDDILGELCEDEVKEYAVENDPDGVLERLYDHDPDLFENDQHTYRFVINMFKRLPVTSQLAAMAHVSSPMSRAVHAFLNRLEAAEVEGFQGFTEKAETDFFCALRLLVHSAETRDWLTEELGAWAAENQEAYCPANQLHLFKLEEMTNDTQDQ